MLSNVILSQFEQSAMIVKTEWRKEDTSGEHAVHVAEGYDEEYVREASLTE